MNIDFNKLVNLLMPTFLRSESLVAIYKAVSTPLTFEYEQFKAWQSDMRLQAAMTCQVMYIEAILNYRLFGNFLKTIYITDGDGIIVDFIVNIPSGITVNGQLLVSLLEKYKLKGKRYSIGQTTVTYEIAWTDPVCELNGITYEAFWTDPVCEKTDVGPIDNNIRVFFSGYGAYVESDYTVASNVTIVVNLSIAHTGQDGNYNFYLPLGTSQSEAFLSDYGIISADIVSITPNSDSSYNYTNELTPQR